MDSEDFPVHENLEVIDGQTLSKNEDWWKAAVVCDGYYGPEISVYLWQNKNGVWKRKQKLNIKNEEDWQELKLLMDSFVEDYLQEGQEE
jgi:hypothetical protein